MKHLIGMESNAFNPNNEFGINFDEFKKRGIEALDYQGLASFDILGSALNLDAEEFVSFLSRLKSKLDDYELQIVQLHAMWEPKFEFENQNKDMFIYYRKAIEGASILGAKYVVVHPIAVRGKYIWDKAPLEELKAVNKVFFSRLVKVAEEKGVYIAIENLPFTNVKDFFSGSGTLNFVKELNHPNIVMCLDTGHFNMLKDENIYDFLLKGKDKIKCLHIHDNRGDSDYHLMPYLGTFKWEEFLKGLNDIHFDGVLSFETKIDKKGLSDESFELLNKSLVSIIKGFRDKLDNDF